MLDAWRTDLHSSPRIRGRVLPVSTRTSPTILCPEFEMNPNKNFWDSESITSLLLNYPWVVHTALLPCSGHALPKHTRKPLLTLLPGPGAGSSRKPSCEIKAPCANPRDLDKCHVMSSSVGVSRKAGFTYRRLVWSCESHLQRPPLGMAANSLLQQPQENSSRTLNPHSRLDSLESTNTHSRLTKLPINPAFIWKETGWRVGGWWWQTASGR